MRLTDLIIESTETEFTGVPSVDDLVQNVSIKSIIDADLPIAAKESAWLTLDNPTRICRNFLFKSPVKVRYFVNEMLGYQNLSQHHCMMTIQENEVYIETYTHDVQNITTQDLKLSKFADEVYNDTRFFSS